MFTFIAKTFQGLEPILAQELTELGANEIEIGRRMVAFSGDKEMLYRANFCLRTAVRILKPIKTFEAKNADEIYENLKSFAWDEIFDVKNTFAVDAVTFGEDFRNSRFVTYRVKDAVVDYFMEKEGKRPNISVANPDFYLNIHIAGTTVTLSLDSSGESLHQRGYRTGTVKAPLNEILAAAMIMTSGWKGETDFIDPFCGSGTLLIEAALIARNIYPGVFRKHFAFEKWRDFDADLLGEIYNDDSQEREFTHHIYGYDVDAKAIAIATENVRSAGVSADVTLLRQDFADCKQPQEKSLIVTNPPYGERLKPDAIEDLYRMIGSQLKHQFVDGDAWIISSREELFAAMGMRPSLRVPMLNGELECELRKYQIFGGGMKEFKTAGKNLKTDDERRRMNDNSRKFARQSSFKKEFRDEKPREDHRTEEEKEFDRKYALLKKKHEEYERQQRRKNNKR